MKIIIKSIAPLILSFLLLVGFFVYSSQNANAKGIYISVGQGKSGLQSCNPGGLICIIISFNAANSDIMGDAELSPGHLTLSFAPNDMLKGMSDTERKLVIDQDVSFDSDLCQYLGVPALTVKAGTYDIKIDGCNAELVLTSQ